MPWTSSEGTRVNEDVLLRLYSEWSKQELAMLEFHYKYRNYYTTIVSALFVVLITGTLQYYTHPLVLLFLLSVSFMILVTSELGKRTISRYYGHFLDSVTILAKIENLLGLDRSVSYKDTPRDIIWPNDKILIPERFLKSRKEHMSSQEFVDENVKKATNELAYWTFNLFEMLSVLITVILLLVKALAIAR